MKISMRSALLLMLPALLLAGCATSGRDFDSAKVSQIKKGETTEQQLVTMFGEPTQRAIDSEGMTHLTWQYMEARANGKNFIPVYGMFHHETDTANKTLMVTLKEGIVTNYTASQGANESHLNG